MQHQWYPWLTLPYRQLIKQYVNGQGHHALLLHSLAGGGIEALAYGISRRLLCLKPDGEKSCYQCRSCQLMKAHSHPDYHIVAAEKGKYSIGIEAVRQLVEVLHSYAQQGGAKVIWLAQADLLTEAAANALLKTLEEPPKLTYFLLASHEPMRLPATLRSRCLYWYLAAPEETMGLQWLERQGIGEPSDRLTALRLCANMPLAAEKLLQPTQWHRRLRLAAALEQAISETNMLLLLAELNQDDAVLQLQWLSSLLLDTIKWHQAIKKYMVNQDQLPLIEKLANIMNVSALNYQNSELLVCRDQLLTINGINRELLLTKQLLNWQQLLNKVNDSYPHLL